MSKETTITTTSIDASERTLHQHSGELAAPEGLRQSLIRRGRAALNQVNGFTLTELPEPVHTEEEKHEITQLEEAFNQPAYTPEHERSEGRYAKVRSALGTLAARANLRLMGAHESTRFGRATRYVAEKHQNYRDKFEAQQDDGRFVRARKFLARNAIELTAGVGTAAAVGTLFYLRTRGIDWTEHTIGGIPTRHLEVKNLAVETTFWIGGRGDGDGNMFVDQAQQGGQYNYSANNIQANYSAQIAPLDGDRMDVSTSVAGDQALYAYNSAGGASGQPFEVRAFSEGTVGAVDFLKRVAAENGGTVPSNITVFVDGGPKGAMGLYNSPYVGAVSPVLEQMGIDPNTDIPPGANIVVRTYSGDVWGNGGNQAGATELAQAVTVGTNHRPIIDGSPLISRKVINGITYEEYGYPDGLVNPISEGLSQSGMYVSPEADRFFDSIVPVTHLGEATQYANANEVSDATAALIDDTIKRNTGMDSHLAGQIEQSIINGHPERASDLQTIFTAAERTPDRFARMAADPSTIPTELPQAMNEIQSAVKTSTNYLEPNKWIDIINDGLRGAGVGSFQLPHFEQMQQTIAAATNNGGGINVRSGVTSGMSALQESTGSPTPVANIAHDVVNNFVAPTAPEVQAPVNNVIDNVVNNVVKPLMDNVNNAPAASTGRPTPVLNMLKDISNTFAPQRANNEIHQNTGVSLAPIPAAVEPAAPAPIAPAPQMPNLAPQIQQGLQVANDLLGSLFRPAR